MNDDSFTPEERALIERLSNAPQPDLTPDAFEAIRAQMLDAVDSPPSGTPLPGPKPPVNIFVAAGAVALVSIVVVAVAITSLQRPNETPLAAPSATIAPTATPILPTATPIPSEIAATQEAIPQSVSDTPTPTGTAAESPTATLESVIVVEGPVQAIDGNEIIVFGISILVDPEDPLLDSIQVGDVLYIDATYDSDIRCYCSRHNRTHCGGSNPAATYPGHRRRDGTGNQCQPRNRRSVAG